MNPEEGASFTARIKADLGEMKFQILVLHTQLEARDALIASLRDELELAKTQQT